MKVKFLLAVLIAFIAGGLAVFYFTKAHPAAAAETEAATESRHGPNGESIVTIDEETQVRIGLVITNPAASQWQPEIKAYGRVLDPAPLSAAVSDLESARATAELSGKELERLKKLAADNNVSARNLEAATAAAAHDKLVLATAQTRFTLDWGKRLAENSADILKSILNRENSLVRVDLPPGEIRNLTARTARIWTLNDSKDSVSADFFDASPAVDSLTQMQSFLFVTRNVWLTPGTAVSASMKSDGEAQAGVVVPTSAILRHAGKGWIYLQTETNQFTRAEVPLDHLADGGWFVSENLSATNRVVVAGAQTILSAELNGGGFNAGGRD